MATNWFSDMLGGTANLLESIPILGNIIKGADKLAANTDPSQLGTATIGKLIGGDFEDKYTSEEARIGAAHTVGTAALSYLLSGANAAGEAAPAAGEASSTTAAEIAAGADSAPASTTMLNAGNSEEAGNIFATGAEDSMFSKLASNKLLAKYISSFGADLAKYGGNTDQGMQFTNVNNTTNQQIQSQNFAKLMSQLLSQDESSGKFDNKGITINTRKDSALYKNFLGENDWFKSDSSLSLGDKKSLFNKYKPSSTTVPNQAEVERARKTGTINLANPFFSGT